MDSVMWEAVIDGLRKRICVYSCNIAEKAGYDSTECFEFMKNLAEACGHPEREGFRVVLWELENAYGIGNRDDLKANFRILAIEMHLNGCDMPEIAKAVLAYLNETTARHLRIGRRR